MAETTPPDLEKRIAELEARIREFETGESQPFTSRLFRIMHDVYYRTDLEGNVLETSPSAERVFGYKVDEVGGMNLGRDFYCNPADREKFVTRLKAEGYVHEFEAPLKRKDGTVIWVSTNATFWRDAEGAVAGVEGLTRDISARRRAEEAQRDIDDKFQNFLRDSTYGYAELDLQGRITFFNERLREMIGYDASEVIGKDVLDLMLPEERQRAISEIGALMTMPNNGPREHAVIMKSGAIKPMDVNAFLLKQDGRPVMLQATLVDITERKLAAQKIQESEERFREFATLLPAIAAELDQAGMVRFANRFACEISGYTEAELLDNFHISRLFIDSEKNRLEAHIARVLSGEDVGANEYIVQRKDGTTFPVLSRSTPIMRDGRAIGLRNVGFDMSDLKQAEDARTQAEEQLARAQKLEAIGKLAGGVAHDFNNLLTVIKGGMELALGLPGLSPAAREELEPALEAADRAAGLVRQLLLFSRRQPVAFGPVDMNLTIHSLMRMLKRLLGEDVRIRTALAENLPLVNGDTGNLEQILVNICVNARDAMPEGGIITISTSTVTFTRQDVAYGGDTREGDFVCLAIRDTGTGIHPKDIPSIFDPFFTTKAPGKGTGLGLSVVYAIAKRHEGWVSVSSTMGKGTEFLVYLPAAEPAPPQLIGMSAADRAVKGRGQLILLVEDEQPVRDMVTRILTGTGYRVAHAGSAEEAQKVYDEQREDINLIISDVVLPGENGVKFVTDIRQENKKVRLLLTSGYADDRARWEKIKSLGLPFLHKPYAVTDLLAMVGDTLQAPVKKTRRRKR